MGRMASMETAPSDIEPAVQSYQLCVYEIAALCSKLSENTGTISDDDTEMLVAIMKDFDQLHERLTTLPTSTLTKRSVRHLHSLGEKQLLKRYRGMMFKKKMAGIKEAMEEMEKDFETLNEAYTVGNDTTIHTGVELERVNNRLLDVENVVRKKQRTRLGSLEGER